MSGICVLAFTHEQDPQRVDELLTRMGEAVPHRQRSGRVQSVDGWGGLAQLVMRAAGGKGQVHAGASGPDASTHSHDSGFPFRHPGTGVEVVADARIDNRPELEATLDVPASAPDGALLAEAYLRWGERFAKYLLGDFSVALRDPRHRRLVLARDPMSMRSLFYRAEPGRLAAASEVKQILALPGVPHELHEAMAACYLVGVFGDLGWSYWAGVSQLPPGHVLVAEPGRTRLSPFWEIDPGYRLRYRSEDEYAEHLRELFVDAVRCRLRDRRTVGVFLSGGLDSGAAAAAMGWLRERADGFDGDIYTYSWDFGPLQECDERERSQLLVDRFGFHGRDIPTAGAGPLAGYPDEWVDPDDPFHGHYQTLLDRGMRAAADDGVVSLFTGMRGDLVMGPTHVDYRSLRRVGAWGALLRELVVHNDVTGEGMVRLLREHLGGGTMRGVLRPLARGLLRPQVVPEVDVELPPWIDPGLVRRVRLVELIREFAALRPPELEGAFRRARYQWISTPMIHRWAVSNERRASRFGLEAVDPWSDRRIVEFAVAIPQQVMDLSFSQDKRLIREAMRGVMPEDFRVQAGKTVPTSLFYDGFRARGSEMARILLLNTAGQERSWIDEISLRRHFERFLGGRPLRGDFWWAASLEWWLRRVSVTA